MYIIISIIVVYILIMCVLLSVSNLNKKLIHDAEQFDETIKQTKDYLERLIKNSNELQRDGLLREIQFISETSNEYTNKAIYDLCGGLGLIKESITIKNKHCSRSRLKFVDIEFYTINNIVVSCVDRPDLIGSEHVFDQLTNQHVFTTNQKIQKTYEAQ